MPQAEVYKNADRALKALAKRDIQFDVIFLILLTKRVN